MKTNKYHIKLAKWASVSGYTAGVKSPVWMTHWDSDNKFYADCELFGSHAMNVIGRKPMKPVYGPVYIN